MQSCHEDTTFRDVDKIYKDSPHSVTAMGTTKRPQWEGWYAF